MRTAHRLIAAGVTLVVGSAVLMAQAPARASEEGRRNTALALGAAAAALLLTQHDKTAGVIAGAGAAYAYKRYDDAIGARHDRERYGYYDYRDNDRYRNDRYNNDRYNSDRYRNDRYYNDRYSNSRYDGDRYYNNRNDYRYDGRNHRGDHDRDDR